MTRVRRKTGSSEQFARRKSFDGDSSGRTSRNPVMFVVCAVLGWIYSLPVEEATLRYMSFGASVGAVGGIALSGAGSFLSRLLALDATALGTLAVVMVSLVVWLWYLVSVVRKQRGAEVSSPTWMVWLFGVGYVSLMMLMFLVTAAPILH